MSDNKEKFEAILLEEWKAELNKLDIRISPGMNNIDGALSRAIISSMQLSYDLGANESKWISVDGINILPDDLPQQEVLAIGKNGEYLLGFIGHTSNGYYCESENEMLLCVTHYKHLSPPQLPAQSDTEPKDLAKQLDAALKLIEQQRKEIEGLRVIDKERMEKCFYTGIFIGNL